MKRVFYIFLFLYGYTYAQTQTPLQDSSYNYLLNQYYHYKQKDVEASNLYLKAYFNKAQADNDTVKLTKAYSVKYNNIHDPDSIYIEFLNRFIYATRNKPTKVYPSFFYLKKFEYYFTLSNDKEALRQLLLAKKNAESVKNDSLIFTIQTRLADMHVKMKKFEEANEIYAKNFQYYQKNITKIPIDDLFVLLFNKSYNHSILKQHDSALYYSRLGVDLCHENKLQKNYFLLRQGVVAYDLQDYPSSIENVSRAVPYLIQDGNLMVLTEAYSILGNSHKKLNNTQETLKYFKLIDSIYIQTNKHYKNQRVAFVELHNHYKKENNLEMQLKYMQKIIAFDSIYYVNTNSLNTIFEVEYERPKLMAQRENVVEELRYELLISRLVKYGSFLVSFVLLLLLVIQLRRRKNPQNQPDEFASNPVSNTVIHANKRLEPLDIPTKVIDKIRFGLEQFENTHEFKNPEINLTFLSHLLGTNSNYLSRFINHYKGVNFSSYLNQLRVDHALEILKSDSKIRKYSIKGIAEEVGYKNAESFSNAFYKRTGMKPSYYIKRLGKIKS